MEYMNNSTIISTSLSQRLLITLQPGNTFSMKKSGVRLSNMTVQSTWYKKNISKKNTFERKNWRNVQNINKGKKSIEVPLHYTKLTHQLLFQKHKA